MSRLYEALKSFCTHTEGTTLVEYALALALVTIIVLAAITAFGSALSTAFSNATTSI